MRKNIRISVPKDGQITMQKHKTSANMVHRHNRMYPVVMKNEIINFVGECMEPEKNHME